MADEKKKILIVDDDNMLLEMYVRKFNHAGFTVIGSLGSSDALQKIKDGLVPDVVLTDVLMPNIDGFELVEKIKKEPQLAHTKVIILSNKGEQSDIEKGKQVGADGYIVKASLIPSEVVEKVKGFLNA